MEQKPIQLSVLITTHIFPDNLEDILSGVLHINKSMVEVIIVDDAANKQVKNLIQEQIALTNNERVFLFEHDRPTGRGNSLNEALLQANGQFIWAPVTANRFNEMLLKEAVRRFSSDPAAFWVLDYDLPSSSKMWAEAAIEGALPCDSCFIWNRGILESNSFFFNPFLDHTHGADLAYRLHETNAWKKTDPFFVVDRDYSTPLAGKAREEFLFTILRKEQDPDVRKNLLQDIGEIETDDEQKESMDDLLFQARQILDQGDGARALELINRFLKTNPNHPEGSGLKVAALEKLRRHVEAAEFKHSLKSLEPIKPEQVELFNESEEESTEKKVEPKDIEISVIIPTTGLGKTQLEKCLVSLESNVDAATTELIVVDNASIDDTFDYLQQLEERNFLNLRVITNQTNKGFGASLNQGKEVAQGAHILCMHNDVVIEPHTVKTLQKALIENETAGLSAPLVDPTDFPAQQPDQEEDEQYTSTDNIDSCCFMISKNCPFEFDEAYGPAFFEIDDFCMQLITNDREILIAHHTTVIHNAGGTISMMGARLIPQNKWKNRAMFFEKWRGKPDYELPKQGTAADRFEALGAPVDPTNPEQEWIDIVGNYLTDEVKTTIVRSDLQTEELVTIISTLLIANQRDLMRTLEDRLDDVELPDAFLLLMVQYYFDKNIYSRCKHYLSKAGNSHPAFDLFRLKISVADKEIEESSRLLSSLLESYPASPDLFYQAGQLYRHMGEEDEAKTFFAMANQMNPRKFQTEETAFEIKF